MSQCVDGCLGERLGKCFCQEKDRFSFVVEASGLVRMLTSA